MPNKNTVKALILAVGVCAVVVGTHIGATLLLHNPVLATLCANLCLLVALPVVLSIIHATRRVFSSRTRSGATAYRTTPATARVRQHITKRWIALTMITGCLALLSGQLILQYAPVQQTYTVRNMQVLGNPVLTAFLLLFSSMFLAPVTEEYIYRFLLQRKITSWVAPSTAIIISAVSFSLSHGAVSSSMAVLLAGFWFAIIFHISGSLLAVVAAHALYNICVNLSHYLFELDGVLATLSVHPLNMAVTSVIITLTIIGLLYMMRPVLVQN